MGKCSKNALVIKYVYECMCARLKLHDSLIALLLGRLRLSVQDARKEFVRICKEVFSDSRPIKSNKYDEKKLENAVKELLERYHGPGFKDERMEGVDPDPGCKVLVGAILLLSRSHY